MHNLKHEKLARPLFERNEKYMTKLNVSLLVRHTQLINLGLIGDANKTSMAAEMHRAHERYLTKHVHEKQDEIRAWYKRVYEQKTALQNWMFSPVPADGVRPPRPETPDLKTIADRDTRGCHMTFVGMTDDHADLFTLLIEVRGMTIGALTEEAYEDHIEAEMFDDLDDFRDRFKAATDMSEDEIDQIM